MGVSSEKLQSPVEKMIVTLVFCLSVASSMQGLRGPVDHSVVIPDGGSCQGQEDGTKCNKKCIDLTCSSILARCFQGQCKRFPNHPCDTSDNHSCCCGNCYLPKEHKENKPCFEHFLK